MKRRTFIGVIAGGLLAPPVAAEAQRAARVWRIGTLHTSSEKDQAERVAALERGLADSAISPGGMSSSSTGTPDRRWGACPSSPPIWSAPGST